MHHLFIQLYLAIWKNKKNFIFFFFSFFTCIKNRNVNITNVIFPFKITSNIKTKGGSNQLVSSSSFIFSINHFVCKMSKNSLKKKVNHNSTEHRGLNEWMIHMQYSWMSCHILYNSPVVWTCCPIDSNELPLRQQVSRWLWPVNFNSSQPPHYKRTR